MTKKLEEERNKLYDKDHDLMKKRHELHMKINHIEEELLLEKGKEYLGNCYRQSFFDEDGTGNNFVKVIGYSKSGYSVLCIRKRDGHNGFIIRVEKGDKLPWGEEINESEFDDELIECIDSLSRWIGKERDFNE